MEAGASPWASVVIAFASRLRKTRPVGHSNVFHSRASSTGRAGASSRLAAISARMTNGGSPREGGVGWHAMIDRARFGSLRLPTMITARGPVRAAATAAEVRVSYRRSALGSQVGRRDIWPAFRQPPEAPPQWPPGRRPQTPCNKPPGRQRPAAEAPRRTRGHGQQPRAPPQQAADRRPSAAARTAATTTRPPSISRRHRRNDHPTVADQQPQAPPQQAADRRPSAAARTAATSTRPPPVSSRRHRRNNRRRRTGPELMERRRRHRHRGRPRPWRGA